MLPGRSELRPHCCVWLATGADMKEALDENEIWLGALEAAAAVELKGRPALLGRWRRRRVTAALVGSMADIETLHVVPSSNHDLWRAALGAGLVEGEEMLAQRATEVVRSWRDRQLRALAPTGAGLTAPVESPPPADEPAGASGEPARYAECQAQRRARLERRRDELKAQGVRDFTKRIAAEEGISEARVRQLLRASTPSARAPSADDPFGLTRKPIGQKRKR